MGMGEQFSVRWAGRTHKIGERSAMKRISGVVIRGRKLVENEDQQWARDGEATGQYWEGEVEE